ncbi:MAG: TMEM165/GDT1 family protein [Deltaproteobacteria bacterium]|nr:TMEM165/GDT1 family protein [Deltaproteobacteria bacterium]
MEDFWLALFLIFVAEMGDKTQMVALTLSTRFNTRVVLAGVFAATLLVHAFSVLLGDLTGKFLPPGWLQILCGLAFVGFGAWTLRGDTAEDGNGRLSKLNSPFLIVGATFFLAELGDKTMLGTVTLAAQYSPVNVWLGSTLGMVLSDGLAIWVGQVLGRHLPERAIQVGAATIFFAVGLYYALQGISLLR